MFSSLISRSCDTIVQNTCRHLHYNSTKLNKLDFGFLFDIDGVIVRGKKLLPSAKETFGLLTKNGKFMVPSLFVTNAGNSLRSRKAKQLSEWLDVEVTEDQVVMSHSPLRMFSQFHDMHILVNGQGPIKEIAHGLGFTKVTTVDELNQRFPNLDKMSHDRNKPAICAFEDYHPKIDAVILFGEPVRWEVPLQLIVDVLLTNGNPSKHMSDAPYPHIPVLACNMDLLWMSEAHMPRLGHGCFMNVLESIYKKITGQYLKYAALIGKPSELTYHHADYLLTQQARALGIDHVRTIYCVGDNPETDIYGGNLYNRYLRGCRTTQTSKVAGKQRVRQSANLTLLGEDNDAGVLGDFDIDTSTYQKDSVANVRAIKSIEEVVSSVDRTHGCETILVCTGVYSKASTEAMQSSQTPSHAHRDFKIDPSLTKPDHVVHNVLGAVELVLEKENVRV